MPEQNLPLTTDQILDALERYRQSNFRSNGGQALREVFRRNVRAGYLDNDISELLDSQGYYDDLTADELADLSDEEIREMAIDNIDPSDLRGTDLVVTEGVDVPASQLDSEDYNALNFLNNDLKARAAIGTTPTSFDTDNVVVGELLDRARDRYGDVNSLSRLADDVRRSYSSIINLSDAQDPVVPADVTDAMNVFNNFGRRGQDPLLEYEPERVGVQMDALDNLYNFAVQVRNQAETGEALESTRRRYNNLMQEIMRPLNDTSTVQTTLNLGDAGLPARAVETRDSILQALNTPLDDLSPTEQRRITRDANRAVDQLERATQNQRRGQPDLANNLTLRQANAIADMLPADTRQWMAERNISIVDMLEARAQEDVQEEAGRLDDRDRQRYIQRTQRGPRPIEDQRRSLDEVTQANLETMERVYPSDLGGVIPGINEELEKARKEAVREGQIKKAVELERKKVDATLKIKTMLEEFPEVAKVLYPDTSVVGEARPRIAGEAASTVAPYVDTEQLMIMPKARTEVYKRLIDRSGENLAIPIIKNLEDKLTSGDPIQQRKALKTIEEMGAGDVIRNQSAPAGNLQRPVVGGGGYRDINDLGSGQDAAVLMNKIRNRVNKVNEVLRSIDPDILKAILPQETATGTKMLRLDYDEATGAVTPSETGGYGVAVSQYRPQATRGPSLYDPVAALDPEYVSMNALRFFADNPVIGSSSIAFQTMTPKEGLSYHAKDLPKPVADAFARFTSEEALKGLPPGYVVTNDPIGSRDLYEKALDEGDLNSSYYRKLHPFAEKGMELPTLRGLAYQKAGFGPVGEHGRQFAYVDPQGNVVPIQPGRSESPLRGEVGILKTSDSQIPTVTQERLPLSSKAYFSVDPISAGGKGLLELGRAIKRTPAALLPGAADLIPSEEAIDTGFKRGPAAMGQQMGREFVESLPASAAAAAVLSTPLAAPLAPGIGAGMVGTNAVKALNSVVRNTTGEGIVPKLRQFAGTAPRSRVASPQRKEPFRTPTVTPTSAASKKRAQQRANRNELQKRVDLVRERFNPMKGEFGLSELLFGR